MTQNFVSIFILSIVYRMLPIVYATLPTSVVRARILSTATSRFPVFAGTWALGHVKHDVAIREIPLASKVDDPNDFGFSLVSRYHPNLMPTLCTAKYREQQWLITDLADYNLQSVLASGLSHDDLPTHEVFAQAMTALQAIHDAGYGYGPIKATKILLQKRGNRYIVRLNDFRTTTLLSASVDRNLDIKNDTRSLLKVLYAFSCARPVSPRVFELGHLSRRARRHTPRELLTHPAVLSDCKIIEFMCTASERMIVEVKRKRGTPMVDALNDLGAKCSDPDPRYDAEYYLDWWKKFPEELQGLQSPHGGPTCYQNDTKLSKMSSLTYALKCFRNRHSHRGDDPASSRMEIALGNTPSSYVQAWRTSLSRLTCDVWDVIVDPKFRQHFSCLFE
jgi:Ribonuclease 2-5A